MNPIASARSRVSWVSRSAPRPVPSSSMVPLVGRSRPPSRVDFAAPGAALDREPLAVGDGQVQVPDRRDGAAAV
jgi:hypothetical protein